MQIDLLGQMPTTTAGHTHVLTAIDVYSRYLFAVPIKNASAKSVVDGLTSIFARHAYLPTSIMTDKGTQFTSELLREVLDTLNVTIRHATVKHAQTIGTVERSHASVKRILKTRTNESADD